MEQPAQQLDFQNYTVLIVDDSPTNLGVIFDFLDKLGFTIMVAQDGASGLDKITFTVPDLILLDAMMPGLDGFEVCRRLKQNSATRATPVIFMTGLTSVENKVKGFEAGAVDYVTKPVQEEELLARMVTHLRLHSLTQQLQREINDRQQAEQALTTYRDQLEELVEQRTVELSATNAQLRTEMAERQQAEAEIRQQSQRLRELTARLAEVEETERRRLARELHDRVSQDLGILDINLNIIQNTIQAIPPKSDASKVNILETPLAQTLKPQLDNSLELVQQIAKHVYDVMAELRSPVLDDYGIVAALKWYCTQFTARTGVQVVVSGTEDGARLPLASESALFRIAQEALANVAKHARATQVTVNVEQKVALTRLTIADDGIGFEPATLASPSDGQGWGLISMTERAEAIGGRCQIKTRPQQGTQVVVELGNELANRKKS